MTDPGRKMHAYIVLSPSEEARDRLALELAASMVCEGEGSGACGECRHCRKAFGGIHPDVTVVSREKDDSGKTRREIYVRQVREIIADAQIMPNEAEKKVYIIRDGDTMNHSAQNAMLKLLEEPPPSALFVLTGSNAGAFLDTLRSRCGEISSNAEGDVPDREALELAAEYIRLAGTGDPADLFRFMAANEKLETRLAAEFASCLTLKAAELLEDGKNAGNITAEKLMEIIMLAEKAGAYLKANVGVKHVLALLCVQDFS